MRLNPAKPILLQARTHEETIFLRIHDLAEMRGLQVFERINKTTALLSLNR